MMSDDRALLPRGPGSLRLGTRPLRHGRTAPADLRRRGVSRCPLVVGRLQFRYELEIHGYLSEPSAEEEGQQRQGESVTPTVGRGRHVPRPLQRLALQAPLPPPALDQLPAHGALRLPQEEGARAELVVERPL